MRRVLAACALLLVAYIALSFLNSPRGYLGTDTGAKVATLKAMDERGRLDPDVGYWAERWDPAGRLHPLYNTGRLDGRWVNVTTVPTLYAAYPLYKLGGYRLALLLPMLGAVLAALAARAIALRAGATERTGWIAFAVIGLASPLTIYALDFWEHSIGVACIGWAAVFLLDVLRGRSLWRALAAGLLFGLAATMRTEALVYGGLLTAAACVIVLVRRALPRSLAMGALVAAGLLAVLGANIGLEKATIGATLRTERAVGAADIAVSKESPSDSRVEEAALTAVGMHPILEAQSYALGAVLLVLLVLAIRRGGPDDPGLGRVALAGAGALYLLRFADGFGFVPGMVAAAPIVVAGVDERWPERWDRRFWLAAVLALPVVWAFQFTGGAGPQWAGRYILPTTLLLLGAGIVRLATLDVWVRRGLIGLSVAVTAFGLVWLSMRSHDVARSGEALARQPDPVIVSRIAHYLREEGAWYGDKRWLTVPTSAEEPLVAPLLHKAGVDAFAWIDEPGARPPRFDGFVRKSRERIPFIGDVDLEVSHYVSSS